MSRKPYQKFILDDNEYKVVEKIARNLKVDCWFSLDDKTNANGLTTHTMVYDLEHKYNVSLQYGLRALNDAFEADEPLNTSRLTKSEVKIYKSLLERIGV